MERKPNCPMKPGVWCSGSKEDGTCCRETPDHAVGFNSVGAPRKTAPWSATIGMEGYHNPERFRFVSYAIGVPYPEQSLELTRFYRGLEDRIEAGDMPVNICSELSDDDDDDVRVPLPVYREAKRELNGVQLVPELRQYPFNSSEDEYDEECETNTFYQNPARCRWVHEHTNRPGVIRGGDLPDFYPCVQAMKTTVPSWAAPERFRLITRSGYYKNAKNPSWKLPAAVTTFGLLGTALALLLGGCL